MPVRYDIQHTTIYRYRHPVRFGEHRVMFRPRDSHDLRVLATDLDVSPESSVRMNWRAQAVSSPSGSS